MFMLLFISKTRVSLAHADIAAATAAGASAFPSYYYNLVDCDIRTTTTKLGRVSVASRVSSEKVEFNLRFSKIIISHSISLR